MIKKLDYYLIIYQSPKMVHFFVDVSKKDLRRGIASLERRIAEHERNIDEERKEPQPNEGRIFHWQKEIEAFREGMVRKEKRLRKKR